MSQILAFFLGWVAGCAFIGWRACVHIRRAFRSGVQRGIWAERFRTAARAGTTDNEKGTR